MDKKTMLEILNIMEKERQLGKNSDDILRTILLRFKEECMGELKNG